MCRLITVTVKLWLPEGVRETIELRRLGMAEDPRHKTYDPNKVHPRTDHEGPEGVDV
jgi:hypothetical protein